METRSQNPICPGGRKEDRKKNHHSIVLHLNSTLTLVGSTTKDSYPQRQLRKKKKKKAFVCTADGSRFFGLEGSFAGY